MSSATLMTRKQPHVLIEITAVGEINVTWCTKEEVLDEGLRRARQIKDSRFEIHAPDSVSRLDLLIWSSEEIRPSRENHHRS